MSMFAGFLIALPALAALWVFGRLSRALSGFGGGGKSAGKGGGKSPVKMAGALLNVLLCWLVGVGLAFTFIGQWAMAGIEWVTGFFGADLQTAVAVCVIIAVIGAVLADVLSDGKANAIARYGAMALPSVFVFLIGGTLGAEGGEAVNATYDWAVGLMATLGGA